ncbi:MAG: autotransporter assembly complex family protein [Desulfopila sp.]|jgi:translocation and assembly module TamA|nr:autotransporter assembly complex family protein [Desulfopila sp.]
MNQFTRNGILWLCLFLPALMPGILLADDSITVTIEGIEGRLYDNAVAFISIMDSKNQQGLKKTEVQKLHEDAPGEIRQALEPFGYYDANVKSELRREADGWKASYVIDPGEPVRVAAVDIAIDAAPDSSINWIETRENFSLQAGDILDHSRYERGKKRLLERLYDLGYVKAEYGKSEIRIHRQKKSAEIILHVLCGSRYLFGDTVFDQDLLAEEMLAAFINYEKGEPYSPRKLIQLQQMFYQTNFFSQVVVRGEVDQAQGLYIPVTVRLSDPEFFNRYTFGLGYATDDGMRGRVGWENRLFNRFGHKASSELQLAERRNSLDFIYDVPIGDPRYDKMIFGTTYNQEKWEDIDTNLFKGGFRYEYSGGRFKYGAGLELHSEKYEIGATSGETFLPIPNARWSMVYGDDLVDTRNGLFFSINLKGAAESLFADTTFFQGLASGKLIASPFEDIRFISRFSVGATWVDDIDDLPPSLRFYAGGDQSVRGYGYRELGEKDSSGTVVGGRYLLVGSFEVEKDITERWSAAAFVDTGQGFNDWSEDLSTGVGLGVRYKLPFGRIRLDVASAVSEEGQPLRLHLTVGADL